jgi:hypothetical protein
MRAWYETSLHKDEIRRKNESRTWIIITQTRVQDGKFNHLWVKQKRVRVVQVKHISCSTLIVRHFSLQLPGSRQLTLRFSTISLSLSLLPAESRELRLWFSGSLWSTHTMRSRVRWMECPSANTLPCPESNHSEGSSKIPQRGKRWGKGNEGCGAFWVFHFCMRRMCSLQ